MSEGKGLTEGLVPAVVKEGDDVCIETVSYTHLTLPTTERV